MEICSNCPKRSRCTELCKKAEAYVSRDHVSQRELTFSPIAETENDLPIDTLYYYLTNVRAGGTGLTFNHLASYFGESELNFPFLTRLQNKCLQLFYFEGLSYMRIAQRVHKKQSVVKGQLQRARAKIRSFISNSKRV